jgi:hypothetical protein
VRGVEDDTAAGAGNLGDDIFHRDIAERRRAVEVVLLDSAPKAFELADDVGLCAMDSVGAWRAWTDFDQFANVFECLGAIEATGCGRREGRGRIRRLRWCCGIHCRAACVRWLVTAGD